METRSRSWSTTRLKARLWTNLVCLRLLKLSILVSLVLFHLLFLHHFLPFFLRDWQPRKFLHLTHQSLQNGLVKPVVDMAESHVCMDMFQGGLGNQMFQYAAVYVAAMTSNKTVKMSVTDAMKLPFETSAKSYFFFRCSGQTLTERAPCAYDERLLQKSPMDQEGQNIRLQGYWQSWKYFRHYELDLRREFKFDRKVGDMQRKFLERFRNLTVIGVHVRRGDMLDEHFADYGYQLPSKRYFLKAMRWFRKRFSDAMFLVCSNDIPYSKRIFRDQPDVFYSEKHSAAEDLAILAACEHTIMSVGTFGWWGGWLAGGQTIYYKNYARPGSDFDKDFEDEDFFPPTWIGME